MTLNEPHRPLSMVATAVAILVLLTSDCISTPAKLSSNEAALKNELNRKLTAIEKAGQRVQKLSRDLNDLTDVYVDPAGINEGRLTLTTAVPVTTSDVSGSSIYFTPYNGSCISLYNGTSWKVYRFTERQYSLATNPVTSGKNYDVFLYDNAGTLTLELSAAWAGDNTRTDSIALQDGVYVKSGATTRRYLGTFRSTSTTTTADGVAQRYLWNYQNRLRRYLLVNEATNSWAYSTDSWRAANNTANNKVEFIIGLNEVMLTAKAMALGQSNTSGTLDYFASGSGIDSTTVNSSQLLGGGSYSGSNTGVISQAWSHYHGYPSIGYHAVQWLERSNTTGTTFYGDNNIPANYQAGMYAEIEG